MGLSLIQVVIGVLRSSSLLVKVSSSSLLYYYYDSGGSVILEENGSIFQGVLTGLCLIIWLLFVVSIFER